ncbi:hypothetical protein LCGC14_2134960, partial [marine sediment metagenome]
VEEEDRWATVLYTGDEGGVDTIDLDQISEIGPMVRYPS